MIREAKPRDIPAIRALMQAEPGFWQANWRADVLERALDAAQGLAFVCEKRGKIIGFVCGHDLGFRAYLSELVVAEAHRGRGVGRQLVTHLETKLASRGCTILVSDVWRDARGFYEAMDWSPPDVVLLRKKLGRHPCPARGAAKRAKSVDEVFGKLHGSKRPPLTVEQMDATVANRFRH